jgi:hypothetical protein
MRLAPLVIASLSLFAATGGPALAQPNPVVARAEAADLVVGAKVFGKAGQEVGTIAEVAGGNVVLAVGEHRATLAATAFGKTAQGLSLAMTKEQLVAAVEAAAAQTAAKLEAALQVGADVRDSGGKEVVGQVKAVKPDTVEVSTAAGTVLVPRSAMILTEAGLGVSLSAEQFAQAVKQATAGGAGGT